MDTTIKILKCYEGEELEEVAEAIENSCFGDKDSASLFKEQLENDERYVEFFAPVNYGADEELESFLEDKGIPYVRVSQFSDDAPNQMIAYDGVRRFDVPVDGNMNPVVDMRAMKAIIEMLENDDELRALFYANENYIETDINKFYRYGMEDSIAFSPNAVKNNAIDVDIAEEVPAQLENKDGES